MHRKGKFISDRELTEEEFVKKYTNPPLQVGSGEAVIDYLIFRHRWMTNKATWTQVTEKYKLTGLEKETRL